MLEPSSSEEDCDDRGNDDDNADGVSLPSVDIRSMSTVNGDSISVSSSNVHPSSRSTSLPRPISPSPSMASESPKDDVDRSEREEQERRKRIQLYVFVIRCIAYPFNAKQPTDMARRQAKIMRQQLTSIKERFQAFLNGELNINVDEAFQNAVHSYYEVFLKSDRVANMVKSGGYSSHDFREVFKNNIEKRVRNLPEIDGLSKETVLSSWMAKFDQIFKGDEDMRKQTQRLATAASELILSKEQLYEMFQNILGVKKYEHQILYNALQVRRFYLLCLRVCMCGSCLGNSLISSRGNVETSLGHEVHGSHSS